MFSFDFSQKTQKSIPKKGSKVKVSQRSLCSACDAGKMNEEGKEMIPNIALTVQ